MENWSNQTRLDDSWVELIGIDRLKLRDYKIADQDKFDRHKLDYRTK